MAKVVKVKSKYHVYDHIVNITRKFRKKVDADDFALSLEPKKEEKTTE